MERHKCKLCSRTFPNGRALGGHMKAHLATLPLPPKPQPFPSVSSSSFSYSSSSEPEHEQQQQQQQQGHSHSHRESEEKGVVYGLRENPKKSFRVADPEFSFAAAPDAGSVVVQDRESETESKNPTRQRSKRSRRTSPNQNSKEEEPKKPKLSFMESPPPPPPQPEPEPVVSSVSDTSIVEDVAMFLVMLSRDKWSSKNAVKQDQYQEQEHQEEEEELKRSMVGSKGGDGGGCSSKGIKFKKVRGKHQCENCGKTFRSSRALGSHRSICSRGNEPARGGGEGGSDRVFECPFCFKVFGSGQALGGHKRSHLMGMASSSSTANDSVRLKNSRESFIDLNLPAPAEEEDDLGVVSDVSDA